MNQKIKKARGRPKVSPLDNRELARIRKRRQRARLTKNAVSKIELFIPESLKREIAKLAQGRTLSAVGLEALQLWIAKL
jgi:hypothetical protein